MHISDLICAIVALLRICGKSAAHPETEAGDTLGIVRVLIENAAFGWLHNSSGK